ncbi:hypothetical protein Cgig2_019149 [Carnegiea gigantea]|uniref:Pentatricopeptide repeat-containing protein n=1 Tax=Carnegiea gigantea TaxID=171969 RepID=A0A9Q1JTH2_9CARY|nr:hypothetical protein Cgig2_019149 [Carnegiea gigantea]
MMKSKAGIGASISRAFFAFYEPCLHLGLHGNLLHLHPLPYCFFNYPLLGFPAPGFRVHCRHFVTASDDPELFLKSVRQRCKLGFSEVEPALSPFHQMKSLHPPPSVIVFNQLFAAMSKIKPFPPYSTILSLSSNLELSGLRPDHCTIGIRTTVVTATWEGSISGPPFWQWEDVKALLSEMLENNVALMVDSYSMLIDMHCKDGRVDEARAILECMVDRGIAPDVVAYSTLIDGLCKANKLKRTFKYFKEMQLHGIVPNVITFTSLFDGLHKNGHPHRAMALLREMHNNGIALGIMICDIQLDSLCESGCVKGAKAFFSTVISKGLKPDCRMYNTMIKGLCKKGLMTEATELLKKMEYSGYLPNSCTYNNIIRGFILNSDLQTALCYRDIMVNEGFEADVDTMSMFVDLLSSDQLDDSSKELLQKSFFSPKIR